MDISFLTQLIDANKIGGWVRAIVAAGFVALVAKYPLLGNWIDPAVQTQIAAALAALAVGAWSQLTKTDASKVAAASTVAGVEVHVDPQVAPEAVAAVAADPTKPNVVQK